MNVLVTGAAGHLGSVVVRQLVEQGFGVRATDIRYDASLPVPIEPANLLDQWACHRLVEGCDAVVHLGNHPRMPRSLPRQTVYGENTTMTGNILFAAADRGIRKIVYASTIQVIAGTRTGTHEDQPSGLAYLPLDGDLPRQIGNAYALSKAAGEDLVRHLCEQDPAVSATAIRFPALWRREWADRRRARSRPHERTGDRNDFGMTDEGFTYLLVDDAARLILAVLQRQGPGYHCQLPAAADNTLGWPISEVVETFYPNVPLKHPDRPLESLVDIAAITAAVGWEPTPQPAPEPARASSV